MVKYPIDIMLYMFMPICLYPYLNYDASILRVDLSDGSQVTENAEQLVHLQRK